VYARTKALEHKISRVRSIDAASKDATRDPHEEREGPLFRPTLTMCTAVVRVEGTEARLFICRESTFLSW
jgi:hypothetical protein